jgi:hypothetical protein
MKGVSRSYKTGCMLNNFSKVLRYSTSARPPGTKAYPWSTLLVSLESVGFKARAFLNAAMGSVSSQRPPF